MTDRTITFDEFNVGLDSAVADEILLIILYQLVNGNA